MVQVKKGGTFDYYRERGGEGLARKIGGRNLDIPLQVEEEGSRATTFPETAWEKGEKNRRAALVSSDGGKRAGKSVRMHQKKRRKHAE